MDPKLLEELEKLGLIRKQADGTYKATSIPPEDFGRTAAIVDGLKKSVQDLIGSALTGDKLKSTLPEVLEGLGLVEKAEDGTYRAKGAAAGDPKAKTGTPTEAETRLANRIAALEADLKKQHEAAKEKDKKIEQEKQKSALISALTEAQALNPGRDYVHLLDKLEADANGNYVVTLPDENGIDRQFGLKDAVGKYLDANKELKRTSAAPGGGAPAGGGSGKPPAAGVIPKATWSDPAWWAANSEKVMKGEMKAEGLNA